MMHWDYGYGWGGGFGWFFMILFWILVILGIVFLVRAFTRGDKKEEKTETALDIAKKRYAKGEIKKEEFEEIKKDITS